MQLLYMLFRRSLMHVHQLFAVLSPWAGPKPILKCTEEGHVLFLKTKFYCLWQVHLAGNLPQAIHTQVTPPPPVAQYPNRIKEMHKCCLKHALHPFDGHNIKKKNPSIIELPRVKNCISRLCTNPLGPPPPPHAIPK